MTFPQNQPGFKNPGLVVANRVIIVGPNEGLFAYSPSEGFGNLVESTGIAVAGTDSFGNKYLTGNTTYVNSGGKILAVNQEGESVNFFYAPNAGGPFTSIGFLEAQNFTTTAGLIINATTRLIVEGPQTYFTNSGVTPVTANLVEVNGSVAFNGNLRAIVAGVQEGWHNVAGGVGFAAGFDDAAFGGSAPVGYTFENIGGGRVRLRGQIGLTAGAAAGTTVFVLPSAYAPLYEQYYDGGPTNLNGYAKSTGGLKVLGSGGGQVQINSAGVNGNFVSLDGWIIELD